MKPDMFRKPVTILVGLGSRAEVCNVMDAYRHPVEWPVSFRDETHSVALKACQAAMRGEIEAETARAVCSRPLPISMICSPQMPILSSLLTVARTETHTSG